MDLIISHKNGFYWVFYQQILIILDNFEIIFIWALFGLGTAVEEGPCQRRLAELPLITLFWGANGEGSSGHSNVR